MSTLLLLLSAPLQSWGVQGNYTERDTGREPSKSGVIGLLACALGQGRHEPIGDLAALRMGVRVDREGKVSRDFHTAGEGGIYRANGNIEKENVVVSNRYYLADAHFLVGLESRDDALLSRLHNALMRPVWPLYLGRKAFVPSEPPYLPDGLLLNTTLEDALATYPYQGRPYEPIPLQLRWVLDDDSGYERRYDTPISFAERRFLPRFVSTRWEKAPQLPAA
jgi:CRISPR system Cascade subunit CasD